MRAVVDDNWVVKMEDILPTKAPLDGVTARKVAHLLKRVCMLYAADYGCLPVELPSAYFANPGGSDCELKAEFA